MKKLALLMVFVSLAGASLAAETAAPAPLHAPAATTSAGEPDNSKQPILVDSDTLEVFQDEQKAVFSGHVVTTQGTSVIKSDRMIIYYLSKDDIAATTPAAKPVPKTPKNPKDKSNTAGSKKSIKRIDFEGNVFMTNPEEAARSLKGSYDPQKNFITMTGDVILTKDNNILKGTQLDYNMDTGYSKLYSQPAPGEKPTRVRGLFIPNADDQPGSN